MIKKNNAIFELKGESSLSLSLGFSSLILIVALGISFLIKLYLIGLFLGFSLIFLAFFLFSKIINKVVMYEEFIEVNYFGIRASKQIKYNQIKHIYFNKEGFLPTHVYVVKIIDNQEIKKITFFCSKQRFKEVSIHLINKNVKIIDKN